MQWLIQTIKTVKELKVLQEVQHRLPTQVDASSLAEATLVVDNSVNSII